MQSIFKVVKKKRNLRRLSAAWIFLIVLELLCPAFCDVPAFAPASNFSKSQASSLNEQKENTSETSVSNYNHQNQHREQSECNDECLCRAAAIPNLGILVFKAPAVSSEPIISNFSEPVLSSLPPPDQPPKIT